jgi:catechol 2,3-dioxygenase-like lactoylglutathione lyase family enzyme
MMSNPGLDALVTFIYTPDTDRAFRFYETVLGLKLVRDEGAARIYRVAGGGYLGVCRESPQRPCRPDGICLSLVSDDVDGWHATLIARGAAVEGPPAKLEQYGVYSFFLRDPDGHLIEVQRFDDPNWRKA